MTSEDRARFEVLLESIDGKVNVIAEAQAATNDRLDRIEGRLDNLEGKVDNLEIKVDVLQHQMSAMQNEMSGMQNEMSGVKTRLTRIEKHLDLNGAPSRPTRTARKKRTTR